MHEILGLFFAPGLSQFHTLEDMLSQRRPEQQLIRQLLDCH